MTETPTSVAPTGSDRATVSRFSPTERVLHWVHAGAFFSLLATGAALYLPPLASMIGDRPLLKAFHLGAASLWLTALLVLGIAGDHRGLRRTRQELERFTDDDVAWLRRRPGARSGRFNAGQKVHAVLQGALAVLFVVTGVLLWLGERTTSLRFSGTIPVHDACTLAASILVAGHLYLALVHEPTRPAMRGMTEGVVDARYARAHHAAWTPADASPSWRVSVRGAIAASAVGAAGLAGTIALVLGILR